MITGFVLGLLIDAGLIGLIIVLMEKGEFPGWGAMIGCALAIGFATNAVGAALPGILSLLGIVAGAIVGGLMLSWLCEMTFRRAAKATGIYLGIRFVLSLIGMLITGS